MSDALKGLLRSRKFLLLLMDTVVSLTLFVVGHAAPGYVEDAKELILILQPVFVALIAAIAYEDGQAKRANTF